MQDSVSEDLVSCLDKEPRNQDYRYFCMRILKNNGAFVLRFSCVFVFIEQNVCKHEADYRQPARVEGRTGRPGDKLQSPQ